jgi:5'-3' exonuclease
LKALIDGDIVVYRCAASAQEDEPWIACVRADQTIADILENTRADGYTVYLTGTNNFRKQIAPSYKAHRPETRPNHWQAVRDYLELQHRAIIVNGQEADDALGIAQDKVGDTTVICSIDKDLLQIPGKHYNFVKKQSSHVTKEDGIKFLYLQSLIGDRSDNIIGVEGIGPVRAAKALDMLRSEEEYYDVCRTLYNDDERFHLNMKLLYIWQKDNDMWEPPRGLKDIPERSEGEQLGEAENPKQTRFPGETL